MPSAPIGPNEPLRLAALARYEVLDTEPDPAFDRIVALAAQLFQVPVALVSLIDDARQWFKARIGVDACQTDRDLSFCAYAVAMDDVLVVPDATRDARFRANPLVTGPMHIRFYAGAPLRTADGFNLGSLCIIDTVPRPALSEAQEQMLASLAALVVDALEAHRTQRQLSEQQRLLLDQQNQRCLHLSQQLSAVSRASPLAIVTMDLDGRVTSANPATTGIFGFTESELVGRPFPSGCDSGGGTQTEIDWRLALDGPVHGVETRRRHKNGQVVDTSMALAPLRGVDDKITGIVAMVEDIGKRKRLERERRDATAALSIALERAESGNTAKAAFLNNMAHEFRTPLNAIIGFSELIGQEALGSLGNESYRDYAGYIRESGQRLMGLLNNVLDIAQADSEIDLSADEVDIGELIELTVRQLRPSATEGGVRLATSIEPGLIAAGDRHKLGRVLHHLMSNALKFTGTGGSVTVAASAQGGDTLRIVVADTGIGMAPGDVERAFEPFTQMDGGIARRFEGAGLGLPLARRLVARHRGELRLESELGAGTRAIVTLPLQSAALPAHAVLAAG